MSSWRPQNARPSEHATLQTLNPQDLIPPFPTPQVLEIEWLPHSGDSQEPLVLAVTAADGSYRHIEVRPDILRALPRQRKLVRPQSLKPFGRFRPAPLTSPLLLPQAQALALRMLLQQGVRPEWLEAGGPDVQLGDLRWADLLWLGRRVCLIVAGMFSKA